MTGKSTKADFKKFANKVKEKEHREEIDTSNVFKSSSYRYLQVRVTREDSNRLKAAISSNGLSVQSVLIEAINLWMSGYGYPHISDHGTAREKYSDSR